MERRISNMGRHFFPQREEDCRKMIDGLLAGSAGDGGPEAPAVAGIAPHAGWVYSGSTAAAVARQLCESGRPETAVLLGAVHRARISQPAVYPHGRWSTPLGPVEVDEDLAGLILADRALAAKADPGAHNDEHSIEVLVPLLQHFCPDIKIAPIMIPPIGDAARFGARLGEILKGYGRKTAVLASTDLTHYGCNYGFAGHGEGLEGLKWVKEVNDKRMVELFLSMKDGEIVSEAIRNRNACGAGAAAAAVAAAKARGKKEGRLVNYTTSYDERPTPECELVVGYAGVVF